MSATTTKRRSLGAYRRQIASFFAEETAALAEDRPAARKALAAVRRKVRKLTIERDAAQGALDDAEAEEREAEGDEADVGHRQSHLEDVARHEPELAAEVGLDVPADTEAPELQSHVALWDDVFGPLGVPQPGLLPDFIPIVFEKLLARGLPRVDALALVESAVRRRRDWLETRTGQPDGGRWAADLAYHREALGLLKGYD